MEKNQILIHYGTDIPAMTTALLEQAELQRMVKPSMRICIKPNLVVAKPSQTGATTSPEIVEAVILFLQEHGCGDIVIAESSWVGENTARAFKKCGYSPLADKYNVELMALEKSPCIEKQIEDLSLIVSKEIIDADFFINIPVLKGHCQVKMTCAMKNLKGCIPNDEKRRYHRLGIHKPVAYLNALIRQDFILVDAIQGDLTFEEGGTPVNMDRIIAGTDPVLIDAYCAALIGYTLEELEYIRIGEQLGVGKSDLLKAEIIEFGEREKLASLVQKGGNIDGLGKYVIQKDACSSCYGNVIHALSRLQSKNLLQHVTVPLYIGQKYQGTSCKGIGIGKCTNQFQRSIPGCPPSARRIIEYLERQLL